MKNVPDDVDSMKHLLQYGFLGTNIKVIQAIDTGDALPFVYHNETNDGDDCEGEQGSKEAEELCDVLDSLNLERYLCNLS